MNAKIKVRLVIALWRYVNLIKPLKLMNNRKWEWEMNDFVYVLPHCEVKSQRWWWCDMQFKTIKSVCSFQLKRQIRGTFMRPAHTHQMPHFILEKRKQKLCVRFKSILLIITMDSKLNMKFVFYLVSLFVYCNKIDCFLTAFQMFNIAGDIAAPI